MKTLSIFSPRTTVGVALRTDVLKLAEALGFQVRPDNALSQVEFFRAILCDDTVVVDASFEDGHDEVFRALNELAKTFPHVLIVSRTPLPLNLVPCIAGGAPTYGHTLTNETILAWLEEQLRKRIDEAPEPRLSPEELSNLGSDPAPFHAMRKAAQDKRAKDAEGRRRIFISHRGRYYREVKELEARVLHGEFPGYKNVDVRGIAPGEFALENELLSEARRWMVVGLLEDELSASDEVWIYHTDDYRASWWTLGELVAVAYARRDGKTSPKIRVFDPQTERLTDGDDTYLIPLAERQRAKLARFFANTRPGTMGPESRTPIKRLRWFFRLGLGGMCARMLGSAVRSQGAQAMPWKMMPPDMDPTGAVQSETERTLSDKEELERFINDRVFDDAFWDELCVESSIVTGQTDHYAPDAEAFIRAVGERMVHFSQREVERAVRGRRLVKDGKEWSDAAIEEGAPRHVWKPQRVGTFSKGGLIRLPTYLVRREAD